MAKALQGQVRLSGGFPAGAQVQLFERRGDVFTPALATVGRARKVSEESEVEFDGLEEGASYWVAGEIDGEWRSRAVTAKAAPERKRATRVRLEDAPSLRHQTDHGVTVSGVRTTADQKRVRGHVKHTDSPALAQDATNVGRQDGVVALGDPDAPEQLASDTVLGQAIPAQPGRLQQEDIPDNVPQASSTETGDAAPVQTYPQQDDVPARTGQSSSTEVGEATPVDKPVVPDEVPDKALTTEKVDELIAKHGTAEAAAEALRKERASKPRTRSTAARRSRSRKARVTSASTQRARPAEKVGGLTAAERSERSRKAAATRKRNAAAKAKK